MQLLRTISLSSYLLGSAAGRTLFSGRPYVGSAEQHAERDAISEEVAARRAAYAAAFKTVNTTIDVTEAVNRHSNVSTDALDSANRLVDAAIQRWESTYEPYVTNPRPNLYKSQQAGPGRRKPRSSREGSSRFTARDAAEEDAVLAAAALLAEVDAADRVFRNVKDYGAKGDGVTDDTAAINKAITDGKRCGADCLSDTTTPALVYFPNGTYLVSSTIVGLYQTQLVGDPNNRATIRASAKFVGKDGTTGIISSDVYIDGGGGQKWYLETSNFYRQVRNLIIDIIDVKAVNASCLHWQVAQATSLENVACYMSAAKDTTQRGIFCENGSGGWMADLEFSNGQIGVYGGEQQFTAVAMYFAGCKTAAQFIWDWGWTWQGIYVIDADVAFKLFDDGGARGVGSFLLQDATIDSCSTGILTLPVKDGSKSGTTNIVLDTVAFSGVSRPVADTSGTVLLSGGDPLEILDAWTVGNDYVQGDTSTNTGGSTLFTSGTHVSSNRLKVLTGGDTGGWSSKWYLFRRKPQYEDIDINSWVNVKDYRAKGDGVTDDTQAFKAIFSFVGQKFPHIFIPHGVYLISDTIYVGGGFDVVGECWSQLMAKGSSFSGLSQPKVFIQV
ncbi:pectin lyase-like protein [Coniochaeta ligniaria NRRL 30616]|uniref:Pectin lyase-like protein n=1 Tax=Coniochaeta ligniaria NRRL 30616 TaxID=1408157 RepID=A0A1J7IWA4_9PEZI|nr:pectin lyase-like protein [Coniochaeta ligniaria NRRL 30616]